MGNGPLARHAVVSLGLLRSLDDSRLVLCSMAGAGMVSITLGQSATPASRDGTHD